MPNPVMGLTIPASSYRPARDCLQVDQERAGGNVIVRLYQELLSGDGIHQVGHVVLTPFEAGQLAAQLLTAAFPKKDTE